MNPNLTNRIRRLEHTLEALPCTCPDSADLAWPGHQPNPNCETCGGERLIYPLPHHPRGAEALVREALPILKRAYGGNTHADFSTLSDQELDQLKTALQAVEQVASPQPNDPIS